jgi:hypothetical protein
MDLGTLYPGQERRRPSTTRARRQTPLKSRCLAPRSRQFGLTSALTDSHFGQTIFGANEGKGTSYIQ